MHRKSLTGEAKLNRDKAMLNDYIAGMHIAELAEKYGIGCTNVKKSLEVLEGFDAVRRNDRKSPNRKPNNQKRLSKADMEQRNIEAAIAELLLSAQNADTERTANGVPLSPVPVEQAADARRVPEKSLSKASMM